LQIAETAEEVNEAVAIRQRVLSRIGDLARGPGAEKYADEAGIKAAGLAEDSSSLICTPDAIAERLRVIADGGVDTVLLIDPKGEVRSLERFADDIAPKVMTA
jgi:alkanesulfonate monooxygenase SsuD/methylene tetrahydromethanopterin reductase-like flavin-dependent oxidoreductase (luciferase family)